MGPGGPIRPVSQPYEELTPRVMDYPFAANISIMPRVHFGLTAFEQIKDAYSLVSEIAMIDSILTAEMTIYTPRIVDRDGNAEGPDGPFWWFAQKPDRVLPWPVWMGRFLRSLLIYDAPCCYHDLRNQALVTMDGSTIFVCVDEHGGTPKGESPAFVQVIKGQAFGWWTADQIWYKPRSLRENAPYGESPIEKAWSDILLLADIKAFSLAYYREGNLPESFLIPGGDTQLTPDQVVQWERTYNRLMSSNPAERMRMHVLPWAGAHWQETKSPEWPAEQYNQAFANLSFCHGLPISELAKVPGRGLGGKGFEDAMAQSLFRMGLGPIAMHIEAAGQDFLDKLGADGRQFKLALPGTTSDPGAQQKAMLELFQSGGCALDNVRIAYGLDPMPDGKGQVYMVIRGGQVVWLGAPGDLEAQAEVDGAIDQQPETTTQDSTTAKAVIESGKLTPGRTTIFMGDIVKGVTAKLEKVTGCTPDDDLYYMAPIVAPGSVEWPAGGHANEVEIVAMCPEGLPMWPGVWKPVSGENPKLIKRVGGFQAFREQAAYLLDRSLGFYLVPVAYVTKTEEGDMGAVLYFVRDAFKPAEPSVAAYSDYWCSRAAVLDYIAGQGDRHWGNWLTHPYDEQRPVMIDNGLTFPTTNLGIFSPFVDRYVDAPLGPDLLATLKRVANDMDLWETIEHLVGSNATTLARERLSTVLSAGGLLIASTDQPETGETRLTDEPVGTGEQLTKGNRAKRKRK
jgi:hypothetical protein